MDRHSRPAAHRAPASKDKRSSAPSTGAKSAPAKSDRGRADIKTSSSEEHGTRESSSDSTDRDSSDPISSDSQLFACPYAKYNPERYSHINIDKDESEYRNCSTGYWTSVSRLKQHLSRTHDPVPRCDRCWKYFSNDHKLEEHKNKRSCTPRSKPVGLMTLQQHNAYSRREQGQEVEKWLKLYQILFPGDDLPGSVYPEWVAGKDLRTCFELLDKALPTLLYQKFSRSQTNPPQSKPNTSTLFTTNAEIVQEVLEYCKQRFISHIGPRMGPVFADEPLDAPQVLPHRPAPDTSSSTRQERHAGELKKVKDRNSSSSESNVDDEIRRLDTIRRLRIEQESRRGTQQIQAPTIATRYGAQSNMVVPTTTMSYSSVPTTYAAMPMVTQADLMQPYYQGNVEYSMYGMDNLDQYNWAHQGGQGGNDDHRQ